MKHSFPLAALLLLLLAAASCGKEPVVQENRYTSGTAYYYGQYYQNMGVEADVWAMEFYSGSVHYVDSLGAYLGSGKILTFTDVFAPALTADAFPAGTYTADTTLLPHTLMPGRREAGYDIGAYLTTLTDGTTTFVEYLTTGSFTLSPADSGRTDIAFTFRRNGLRTYEAVFSDTLRLFAVY